jgi:hypothetical protein
MGLKLPGISASSETSRVPSDQILRGSTLQKCTHASGLGWIVEGVLRDFAIGSGFAEILAIGTANFGAEAGSLTGRELMDEGWRFRERGFRPPARSHPHHLVLCCFLSGGFFTGEGSWRLLQDLLLFGAWLQEFEFRFRSFLQLRFLFQFFFPPFTV